MKTILYIDGFNFYYEAARRFNLRTGERKHTCYWLKI